jgi:hypothetical protein
MFEKYPAGTLNVTISKFYYGKEKKTRSYTNTISFLVEARKLHGEDFMGTNDPYM